MKLQWIRILNLNLTFSVKGWCHQVSYAERICRQSCCEAQWSNLHCQCIKKIYKGLQWLACNEDELPKDPILATPNRLSICIILHWKFHTAEYQSTGWMQLCAWGGISLAARRSFLAPLQLQSACLYSIMLNMLPVPIHLCTCMVSCQKWQSRPWLCDP